MLLRYCRGPAARLLHAKRECSNINTEIDADRSCLLSELLSDVELASPRRAHINMLKIVDRSQSGFDQG